MIFGIYPYYATDGSFIARREIGSSTFSVEWKWPVL